jgi:catalase
MAVESGGAAVNYETVNAAGSKPQGFGQGDPGWPVEGAAGRYDARGSEDDFTQAGNLFRLLPEVERQHLFDNIAGAMASVSAQIQQRQLGHFDKADAAYGAGVRAALKRLDALKG